MTAQAAEALRADPADAAVAARDDEQVATAHIKSALAVLETANPELAIFCAAFYAGAPPEEVGRYACGALAALAKAVFERSAMRQPGETLVEVFDLPSVEGSPGGKVFLAVNDDKPFLFDSLMGELAAQNIRAHAVFHPIIEVCRDADGARAQRGVPVRESTIVLLLDAVLDEDRRTALVQGACNVFAQVALAVRDWRRMLARLADTISGLRQNPPPISREDLDESIAFLEWLGNNHFTFLGCRDYAFVDAEGGRLEPIAESGLGLLSDTAARVIGRGPDHASLSPEVRAFLAQPEPLIITKTNERTVVHRRVHMDYVGVKIFDGSGKLSGERRFTGLFTSAAYSRRPGDIPLLRLKVARIINRAGLAHDSHDGKALAHILDTYPREELFQASEDEIFATARGVLRLGERPKVRLFLRFDRFDRFVTALLFVPRDRYDTQSREKIHRLLSDAFDGRISAETPVIDASLLARIHFIIGRKPGPRPPVDVRQLEADIRAAIRTWGDGFAQALIQQHGDAEGLRLLRRHAAAFPPRYRDAFAPEEAVRDLSELEVLARSRGSVSARAYNQATDGPSTLRLKLYAAGRVLPLSVSLPIFENLGFRVIAEDSYPVRFGTGDGQPAEAAILDFRMERADAGSARSAEVQTRLEDAFHAVISGSAENDGFNRLIVSTDLPWRDVTILRTCAKFLRQAGIAFSQDYMERALARNSAIAALLVKLFRALQDPEMENREVAAKLLRERIVAALNDVPSLDDDRIIRRLHNVVECVLRTNFFQRDESGLGPDCLSVKLDSHRLDELPAPRPLYEVFVYSPQVEGVHLRFGKVARGGIRWSDRREDFRTEILGLVKAQQVKNAVIVPVGAKGGFFPKELALNATRDEAQAMGIACYKLFINALLDLTDNIRPDGTIAPPPRTRRYDDDDPYFVVAADKGTATFSDIANGIAEARGFWLGDAFASGGSHGYDHKKMGITAKGAWEAVQRHFREMDRDIQTAPFTCIGVGDMSGDVFGNGMLLSKETKLLAAFDHRHIFVDPAPDPQRSWGERKRMFDLPRSSWTDYDRALISKGGGIYPRNAKEIVLSPEAKALIGLEPDRVSPNELILALLTSDVDLLWFGGIGTFVKAVSQSNLDVGDRANDAVRVNGINVRAKVVGEGANLGLTQLGRIEYAMNGGRLNTDAIDNSAGVDTSDHEVNLKILFNGPLRRGELSAGERDRLLNEMTDDVAAHVLRDNYDQTLALSVAEARSSRDLDSHGRFIRDLERRGRLDRAVEFLPDEDELHRRAQAGRGLTRPELAVLLAYAKLDLDAQIVASDLPDQAFFASELAGYFPASAVTRFPEEFIHHRLRREIIATSLANRIVNLAGPVFVHRIEEISSASAVRIARAFVIAEGALGLRELKARIDGLDGKVRAPVQTGAYNEIAELLRRLGLWFLVNVPARADLGDTIGQYCSGVEALRGSFSTLVSPYEAQATEARIAELQKSGMPLDIAEDVAVLPLLGGAPEIVLLAESRKLPIDLVAGAYFAMGAAVGLDRLRGLASRISGHEHWDRLAVRRIVDDLFAGQRALASEALVDCQPGSPAATRTDGAAAVQHWEETHADALARTRSFLTELERGGELSIAKLTLANSQIHALAAR
ncbi:MAG TPA: NAD-glutamate dehydrogenase [Rhizomicrobium sp.]|jgi:glutamate dehydrogenase|nr:NAD-glutamate dehydrogenase [Rhizomicrobium sp.]